jgi:hypothetical protein
MSEYELLLIEWAEIQMLPIPAVLSRHPMNQSASSRAFLAPSVTLRGSNSISLSNPENEHGTAIDDKPIKYKRIINLRIIVSPCSSA